MIRGWFPIPEEEILNPGFNKLAPSEKLLFWLIVSEFNYSGPFYKADQDFARILGASQVTVRVGRRKLQKLGFIEVRQGTQAYGKNLATQYKNVIWSKPPKPGRFAQITRTEFYFILSLLRGRTISNQEAVIYIYLSYLGWISGKGDQYDTFSISKRSLREETNISKSVECAKLLSSKMENRSMFKIEDNHHSITIHEWFKIKDADKDPSMFELSINLEKELKELTERNTSTEEELT